MRTRLPRCRRPSCRLVAAAVAVAGLVGYCYFYNSSIPLQQTASGLNNYMEKESGYVTIATAREEPGAPVMINQEPGQCPALQESHADIDTAELFPSFDFQPSWIKSKEFWDKSFEDRYEKLRKDTTRPSLKVFVVPHSHNDPGWLKTFEQYFEYQTKNILNNMVQKLNEYPNMTFIWTEISFLNAWWERSHPLKQKALKKLVKQGRVEITSGGWVMPDEACTHIYALIDQFIEGHHWVKTNLGVSPRTGWSVDPFGHGATVPYLLDQSGLEGAIIQRIHFIWKQWLAKRQTEEFYWLPGWDSKKPSLVMHNQPFDIYSIKSTCGPHPSICAHYDFKAMEYYEYSVRQTLVTDQSLPKKANTLLEEYERIGSLTPHNVVLVPLGDDFRYDYPNEFDSQYSNYMKMFNYINSNKKLYNAEVRFGTPLDYFNAVKERHKSIPTLKGDFFVYSDIFTDGVPAYWSGYYTTRPYLKIVARQLEHHLRTAEIIFTLVSNSLGQSTKAKLSASEKKLVQSYEHLIMARRNLGLFQHHDAITGTAKARVMFDYGTKLLTSLYHCMRLQEAALSMALAPALAAPGSPKTPPASVLQSEADWDTYGKWAKKLHLSFPDKNKVVLFNPLTVTRLEVITLQSNTSNVRVYDTYNKQYVQVQVNPSITATDAGRRYLCNDHFDILFVATVPPLTAIVYRLESHEDPAARAIVFCMNCNDPAAAKQHFKIKKMMPGNIQLENNALKLLINRNTGFLRQVYRKDVMKKTTVDLQFGAYQSAQRHSGAYLFMPDYDNPEKQVLNAYSNFRNLEDDNLLIVSGPVSTEVVVMYLPFLVHRIRIYNVDDYALSRGILIENDINFEPPPKNRDTEFYMRFNTDIQNKDVPEFYTDQNGFQYQKRRKVMALGIEANYYPITTMAWIQDESTRVSILTAHAQGASSFEPGRLELMLERRTLYDDLRGVGEGVVDNKPACFRHWLLVESLDPADPADPPDPIARPYQLPSPTAEFLSRSFNYPTLVYYVDSAELGKIQLKPHHKFVQNFPDGIHLVTLRTITDDAIDQYPSSSCYMVLQRPGHSCTVPGNHTKTHSHFAINTRFTNLRIHNITSVSLTGLKSYANLSDLTEIHLDPMEIKTYKLGF